ncbi:fimbrial protein [Lelliottia sp. JS-SCA-14]|uniref:fimbrial protein n=1 Tax=Lelliottia sp. JS-SCA-14 TaxID=3110110 RepID=UPI002D77ADF5|nr:fimbrial protein [Lelliottia sp. JS-SCA-14]
MNKKIIAMAMAMAFSGVVGMSNAAQEPISQDVTITGHVLNEISCQVKADATLSFDNIEMTQIGTLESGKPLANGAAKPYMIAVTKCPAGQKISVTIQGTPDAENVQLVALNDAPGAAQGVGIGFWDTIMATNEHKLLAVNDNSSVPREVNSDGAVNIPLSIAPVQSTTEAAVAGTISATTSIKVNFL